MWDVVQCLNLMSVVNGCCCSLQQGKQTQLLHVFEEHLILGIERTESTLETPKSPQNGKI